MARNEYQIHHELQESFEIDIGRKGNRGTNQVLKGDRKEIGNFDGEISPEALDQLDQLFFR